LRVGDLNGAEPVADLERRLSQLRSHGACMDEALLRVSGSVSDTSSRRRVTACAIRELVPKVYDVELDITTHEPSPVRDPRFARAMMPAEALYRYLETRDDWADDREVLAQLGSELIAEVLA
jgi:hypothetical protein